MALKGYASLEGGAESMLQPPQEAQVMPRDTSRHCTSSRLRQMSAQNTQAQKWFWLAGICFAIVVLLGYGTSGAAASSKTQGVAPRGLWQPEEASSAAAVAPQRKALLAMRHPVSAAAPVVRGARTAKLYQTARGRGAPQERMPDVAFSKHHTGSPSHGPVLQLRREALNQYIEGFGGAFTEAAALVFAKLAPAQQRKVVEKYWGPTGIGYTLGRIHINSCDFTAKPYSFDDVDGDFALDKFDDDVSHDRETLIPLVLRAQEALQAQNKRLKLLASPWSPPAWMKRNRQMLHSDRVCLREEAQATWAAYIVRWIEAYRKQGIDLWAVTMQNEPENNATWEGCTWTAEESVAYLGNFLGPYMQAAHPSVLIFVFDHNKDSVYKWAKELYAHPEAARYAAGIAFHWYTGDSFEHIRRVREEFPQAVLLPSEATYEKWRWAKGTKIEDGDWRFGEGYAHDIIGDLNAGAVGWMDWNLLLDSTGGPNHVGNACDAPMMATEDNVVVFHPQLHFIAHFSAYVPPGSRHVSMELPGKKRDTNLKDRPYGTCTQEDGVQATAFQQPDGTFVVVVLNCGDKAAPFELQDDDEVLLGEVPAHAIQTYLFNRETPPWP